MGCFNMWGVCVHCNEGTWYWFCVVQTTQRGWHTSKLCNCYLCSELWSV